MTLALASEEISKRDGPAGTPVAFRPAASNLHPPASAASMYILRRFLRDERGGLAFEWALVLSLVVIGVVGGFAAVRDAIIDEFGDVAQAMLALDHSYSIAPPLSVSVHAGSAAGASDSAFADAAIYSDCARRAAPGQGKSKSKGNNGVGNGDDPPPPGNPPVNDGPGTGPGNPGKGKSK